MLMNSLAYIIFWLSFQLSAGCQMTSFKPRAFHTATYIDNKLYILGGLFIPDAVVRTNEFFYLDFSVPFNTKALSWQDLSNNSIPAHNSAVTVVGGANNNTLFLYGGNTTVSTMELVYAFDPIGKTWSIPKINGINTARKQSLTGMVDDKGNMYLWGGLVVGKEDVNDMLILDTVNLSWERGTFVDAPTSRFLYGAVLLPNQTIIYMGGYDSINSVQQSLKQVYLYDTTNNSWSVNPTLGDIPIGRDSFTAVLGLDGQRIIIFGGIGTDNVASLPPGDALHELDLNTLQWSTPNVTGNIPSSRIFHKANLIRKYMVISFGIGYDQTTESDILLLDISNHDNYIWTETFDSSAPLPPSSSSGLAPSSSKPASSASQPPISIFMIVGIITASLFGGISLSFGGFLLYRRIKNKQLQKNAVLILPGESDCERNFYNSKSEITTTVTTVINSSPI